MDTSGPITPTEASEAIEKAKELPPPTEEELEEKEQKTSKVWMIVAISFMIVAVGAGVGLILTALKSKDRSVEIDWLQAELDAKTAEFDQYKNDTFWIAGGTDAHMKELHIAVNKTLKPSQIILDDSTILKNRSDNKYQLAQLTVCGMAGVTAESWNASAACAGGAVAYAYRSLPDGDWTFAKDLSVQTVPKCEDISDAEKDAFFGEMFKCFETGEVIKL